MFIFIDVLYTKPKWKYAAYATGKCRSVFLSLSFSDQSKERKAGFKFKTIQTVEIFKSHKWHDCVTPNLEWISKGNQNKCGKSSHVKYRIPQESMCPWRRESYKCCFFNKNNECYWYCYVGWRIDDGHTTRLLLSPHLRRWPFIDYVYRFLSSSAILPAWHFFADAKFHNFYMTKMCVNKLITRHCSECWWTVGRQLLLTQSCTQPWNGNARNQMRKRHSETYKLEWTKILESIFVAHQWVSHWPVNVRYALLAQIEISSENLKFVLDKCTVLPLFIHWYSRHTHETINTINLSQVTLTLNFFSRKISIH